MLYFSTDGCINKSLTYLLTAFSQYLCEEHYRVVPRARLEKNVVFLEIFLGV